MLDDLFGWIRGMDRNISDLLLSRPADHFPAERQAWLANRLQSGALRVVIAGGHQTAR